MHWILMTAEVSSHMTITKSGIHTKLKNTLGLNPLAMFSVKIIKLVWLEFMWFNGPIELESIYVFSWFIKQNFLGSWNYKADEVHTKSIQLSEFITNTGQFERWRI